MTLAGATALAAGISATAGAIGSGLNSYSANMANKWNRREAEKNRKWQEDMWNKQNEYNLPVNQLQRIKAAGLNPNLVLGQNGMSTQGASFGGNVGNPQMTSPQYGDMLKGIGSAVELYQQYRMNEANIKAIENKAYADYQQGNLFKSQAYGQDWLNEFNDSTVEVQKKIQEMSLTKDQKWIDKLTSDISLNASKANKIQDECGVLQQEKNVKMEKVKILQRQFYELVDSYQKRMANLDADTANKINSSLNQYWQAKLAESGIEVNKNQAKFLKSLDFKTYQEGLYTKNKNAWFDADQYLEIFKAGADALGKLGEFIPALKNSKTNAKNANTKEMEVKGKLNKKGISPYPLENGTIKLPGDTKGVVYDMYGNPVTH